MWILKKFVEYYREAAQSSTDMYQYHVADNGTLYTTSDEIVQSEKYKRTVRDFALLRHNMEL